MVRGAKNPHNEEAMPGGELIDIRIWFKSDRSEYDMAEPHIPHIPPILSGTGRIARTVL